MATNRQIAQWISGLLVGFLFAVTPALGATPEGNEAKTGNTQQGGLERRLNIVVQKGRLSVDLKDADVHEVLTQIGKQAGITVFFEGTPEERVSTQFTDVELDSGVRYLLGLAPLRHAILYARGPTGAVPIRELHVFGKQKDVQGSPAYAAQRAETSLAQVQAVAPPPTGGDGARGQASPPPGREEGEGARPLWGQVEQGQPQTLPPPGAAESEGARRFREALDRARTQAPQSPGEESEAVRRFREALERARQGAQ